MRFSAVRLLPCMLMKAILPPWKSFTSTVHEFLATGSCVALVLRLPLAPPEQRWATILVEVIFPVLVFQKFNQIESQGRRMHRGSNVF